MRNGPRPSRLPALLLAALGVLVFVLGATTAVSVLPAAGAAEDVAVEESYGLELSRDRRFVRAQRRKLVPRRSRTNCRRWFRPIRSGAVIRRPATWRSRPLRGPPLPLLV